MCLAHMSGNEQKYIQEAFDTNWVVPLGPNVNAFEEELEQFVGENKKVVALSAGTAAVHLALIACGVKAGDEVLVQSFTFCASSHPVTYLGATPVFVDSEPDTWNMDPVLLEHAIEERIRVTGRKPKAIVPVYLYGMPAKIEEIMRVADKYGIPVIEDAAEGLGSRYDGRVCGTFGRYGVLSFNGNKMITTSGGGALICPDEEAKRFAAEMSWDSRVYPVVYFQSDTTGEKDFEEFYVPGEQLNMERFASLGVIENVQKRPMLELETFFNELESIFHEPGFTKAEVVAAIKRFLPNFEHVEKGKNLDQKM